MEPIPKNTPALLVKIDQLRNGLIKRFENLVELASIQKTDRNTTALHEYQMQVETTGLVRAAEEVLALTRQMQELWLFGQLNTLEVNDTQDKVDAKASEVASLLQQLADLDNAQRQTIAT
ncbi:hypothetical protein CAC42_8259 [Sphaceloma murrayae]|uniref:Uncharacterized protein n=1 Tax=Sphaceloma murrayae TaxID=2082308 RepID=A0A2K1QJC0_9PEZI|nr:hypothetical protein CAC42_8259 [Sphaceloma murrayae]